MKYSDQLLNLLLDCSDTDRPGIIFGIKKLKELEEANENLAPTPVIEKKIEPVIVPEKVSVVKPEPEITTDDLIDTFIFGNDPTPKQPTVVKPELSKKDQDFLDSFNFHGRNGNKATAIRTCHNVNCDHPVSWSEEHGDFYYYCGQCFQTKVLMSRCRECGGSVHISPTTGEARELCESCFKASSQMCNTPGCKHTVYVHDDGTPNFFCKGCYEFKAANSSCDSCGDTLYIDMFTGEAENPCRRCQNGTQKKHKCKKAGCDAMIPKQFQFCTDHIIYR